MKKLLASLMALSMVFAVTGCSESSDSSSESKAEAKTTTTTTAAPAVESEADTTTTTAAPEESAADTTTSANDTTSTGDEAKGTYKDNVYTSDLYPHLAAVPGRLHRGQDRLFGQFGVL